MMDDNHAAEGRDEVLAADIKEAVADLKEGEGAALAGEMTEATELAAMAEDAPNWSRRTIARMQLQAFKMAKRSKRKGLHVTHPAKKRRYGAQADLYYANIGNLKAFAHILTPTPAANTDADFMEMETCSAQ